MFSFQTFPQRSPEGWGLFLFLAALSRPGQFGALRRPAAGRSVRASPVVLWQRVGPGRPKSSRPCGSDSQRCAPFGCNLQTVTEAGGGEPEWHAHIRCTDRHHRPRHNLGHHGRGIAAVPSGTGSGGRSRPGRRLVDHACSRPHVVIVGASSAETQMRAGAGFGPSPAPLSKRGGNRRGKVGRRLVPSRRRRCRINGAASLQTHPRVLDGFQQFRFVEAIRAVQPPWPCLHEGANGGSRLGTNVHTSANGTAHRGHYEDRHCWFDAAVSCGTGGRPGNVAA